VVVIYFLFRNGIKKFIGLIASIKIVVKQAKFIYILKVLIYLELKLRFIITKLKDKVY